MVKELRKSAGNMARARPLFTKSNSYCNGLDGTTLKWLQAGGAENSWHLETLYLENTGAA